MNVRIEKYGLRWQSEATTPLAHGCMHPAAWRCVHVALQNRAFTLVELLLVLALLVIITSMVAPAMSNFIRARAVDSEARRLFALMHAGQSRAVSEGLPMMLWVDEKQGAYGLNAETPPKGGDPKAENLTVDENVQISVLNAGATAPDDVPEPAGHPFFGGRHH